ncbi:aminopeptidase N-like [Haliotis cracherodii]|uniref:aminopeptidase N-like n=1 Tax=Haliotis cracherodii TaxID=6455 RepID=UPI0039EAFB4C
MAGGLTSRMASRRTYISTISISILVLLLNTLPSATGTRPMPTVCKGCTSSKPQQDVVFLPKTLKPIYYDLEMRPNMYQGDPSTFTFDGYVRITMECLKATKEVIMHLNDLEIMAGSIEFGSEGGSDSPVFVSYQTDSDNQLLKIALDKDTAVGQMYYAKMNFSGPLKDDLKGFYLSSYTREGKAVYLATTQFESTDARKAFPCFDEPELKAHFNITLVRKTELNSMSNMKIVRTDDRETGFVADVYETTPLMSTYLVAFIVSDFQFISGRTRRGLEYRVWAQKESMNDLDYSLDIGMRTITFYEDYFNITYPLPKQDMVAIPDFAAGAMENWGLITYRAIRLFFTAGVTSNSAKQQVMVVITHELAHQWFGNLVTMKWWDDLWLNEGFATFFMYFGAEVIEPDWDMYNQFVLDEIMPVFEFDGTVTSHPVYVDVESPEEIEQIFDAISYNKGGSVLRMLKFFIGAGTFQRGLTRYLLSREYSNADHDDLWVALGAQAEEEKKTALVVDTMKTWTLQMNYPVVSVSRTGPKQIRLTQERFLFDPASSDPGKYVSPYNYTWNVPFTFTTSQEKNFDVTDADIVWMLRNDTADVYDTTVTIPDPSDESSWILGNIRHHGYYRVNYDEDNWRNIIKQLKTDHDVIIPINRAQIINDAMDLARAGYLQQLMGLQTLEYLSAELNYYPWSTARDKLVYIDEMIRDTEIYPAFQEFLRSSSDAAFRFYGLREPAEGQIESFAQREVSSAACSVFNQDCLQEARDLFLAWKDNPQDNKITPELLLTVLCTGISEGVADDWYHVYDSYQAETSLSTKSDMLRALACSHEDFIIEMLLERAITPSEIPKQDGPGVIASAPGINPFTQPFVWDFIRDKYDVLRNDYSASVGSFTSMIKAATATFNTQAKLEELEEFVRVTPNIGPGAAAFEQAISQTKSNIEWMSLNYPIVKQWLDGLRSRHLFQDK